MTLTVNSRLVPFILSRGFEPDQRELYNPDPYGHLTYRFLRWNGDYLELLEIQFDKHGRARFVFNLGVVPPQGVENAICHYKQLEVGIPRLPKSARLRAGRFLGGWFGPAASKIPFVRKRSSDEAISLAIQLFPQAEAWLRGGAVGPNIG